MSDNNMCENGIPLNRCVSNLIDFISNTQKLLNKNYFCLVNNPEFVKNFHSHSELLCLDNNLTRILADLYWHQYQEQSFKFTSIKWEDMKWLAAFRETKTALDNTEAQ